MPMTHDLEDAIQRRADRLFWTWSTSRLLRGGIHPSAGTLAALHRECERLAAEDVTSDRALLDAAVGFVAGKAGPVRIRPTETKDAPLMLAAFETKAESAVFATVDGYLAVFDNTDLVKDVIHHGAFTKTLREAEEVRRQHGAASLLPLLWQHDKLDPIGYIAAAHEDAHGLRCTFVLDTTIEHGRQAYNGLKSGTLAFSIGYRPIKYDWQGNARHLKEIALGEGSVVTFPANPEARAISRAA